MDVARKGSGRGQTAVVHFNKTSNFEGYVAKPGGVFRAYNEANVCVRAVGYLVGSDYAAWNDEVADAMIEVALEGHEEPLVSSRKIAEMARSIRDAKK